MFTEIVKNLLIQSDRVRALKASDAEKDMYFTGYLSGLLFALGVVKSAEKNISNIQPEK